MQGCAHSMWPETEYDETTREANGFLKGCEAAAYRGVADRLNYLALDKPNVQFAAKEIAKHMANPANLDFIKVKPIAKYLISAPRYVQRYDWQDFDGHFVAFSDSDWAGDKVSRKKYEWRCAFDGEAHDQGMFLRAARHCIQFRQSRTLCSG